MSDNTEYTLTSYLGPEFQQRLMWQLLVEPEFAEKTIPTLAIEYFDDPNYKRLYIIILEYFKEFGKVPNLQNQSILQAINKYKTPNNQIEEESLFGVIKRIELWNERIINKQMLFDGDVVQKQTTSFVKQQEYRKLGEFILSKTKTGEMRDKHTIVEVEDKFQKVAHIGDDEDYGTDVFDNIEFALRKEFRETIPTGVHVIDMLTGGGLGKGEIGIVLTPSGVGKSTFLTKVANTGFENNKNVAQIIFEDTKEQIQRKHFAIWSDTPLSKMDDEVENAKVKEIVYKKIDEMKGKGNLVVKRFSQENTTMVDVKKWMLGYQKKYGIKFDLLVLDYLDCLESHKKTADRNEAELVIIKSFEALASDLNIPAWSAIQTNRSGFNAELVEAHQSGGSIKRIQKAHFFMSVAKTPDQKEAHLANIRIIKARFAQDGQTFNDCIFNNDTMQIIIEDKRYPVKTKGMKTYGDDAVGNLDNMARKYQEKSTQLPIHEAINKYTEDYFVETVNNPKINEYIEGVSEGISEGVKPIVDENIIRNNENPELTETPTERIENEFNKDINEIYSDFNNDEKLVEIENSPIEQTIMNDGVNDGLNDGVNKSDIDEYYHWTGETSTVKFNDNVEVVLEDYIKPELPIIEPKETIIESKQIIEEPIIVPTPIIEEKPVEKLPIIQNNNINEIIFDDPDAPTGGDAEIQKMLELARKHQIVKKE